MDLDVHDCVARARARVIGRSGLVLAAVDVTAALVVLIAWAWVLRNDGDGPATWIDYALASGATLPAGLRRRWPLPSFAVGAVCVLGALVAGPVPGTTAIAVAFSLYTIVATRAVRTVLLVTVVAIGLVLLSYARIPGSDAQSLTLDLLFLAVVLVAGRGALARRENVRLLQERAIRLEEDRQAHAERAVTAERAAIARELHDVVGHAMSQISVQAGMGRMLGSDEPVRATGALAAIETLSREALTEMRRLTSTLRIGAADAHDPSPPVRSLATLDAMVLNLTTSGSEAWLERHGIVRPLPAAVELAAYRIVQESLTNVATHVGRTSVRVRLDYRDHDLHVQVEDTGAVTNSTTGTRGAGTGFGLLGMQERTKALGGRFEAGPTARGFIVRAWLPTGEQP